MEEQEMRDYVDAYIELSTSEGTDMDPDDFALFVTHVQVSHEPRKVEVELTEDMCQDLKWFVNHYEAQRRIVADLGNPEGSINSKAFTVSDVINEMLEDIVDVWSESHSSTGYCGMCHYKEIPSM